VALSLEEDYFMKKIKRAKKVRKNPCSKNQLFMSDPFSRSPDARVDYQACQTFQIKLEAKSINYYA